MQWLWVHPSHTEAFAAAAISGFSDVLAHLGVNAPATGETGVRVMPLKWQLPTADRDVFFKMYIEPPRSFRFLGRASKALRETRNYDAFVRLGIRCPKWIVCGERRDRIGRLHSAFIITEAVPDSMMLHEYASRRPPLQARIAVIEQLADALRVAHEASFFHNDLHWRNILVSGGDSPLVWWIDCPRGRFLPWSPLKRRYRVKDLACLDRGALQHCTTAERMRFIERYLRSGGSAARRLARDVEAYRERRWRD